MRGKSRWIGFVLVGLLVLVVCGYLYSNSQRRSAANAKAFARTVQAYRGNIEVTVSGSGNVAFAEDVQIKSQGSGTVTEVRVKDGELVERGQILFTLENSSLDLQYQQAQSNVQNLRREVEQLQEDISSQQVLAPQAGRITSIGVNEGANINKGTTLLTLVDDSTFSVTIPFLKPQRDQIVVGQTADVFLPEFLTSLPGKVVKIAQSGQAGSGGTIVYPVTVEFSNPGALVEGITATVTVETAQGAVGGADAGTAGPKQVAEVRSQISGEVEKIHIDVGDTVKSGEVLMVVTNDQLADDLKQKMDSLSQAQLSLSSQEKDLTNLTVVASISGIFREVTEDEKSSSDGPSGPIQVGDELKPNDRLGRIVDNSTYKVVINVDELDISQVEVGQKAEVTVDALPGQTLEGTVTEIAEEGTLQTGAAVFPVTISLAPINGLKAGMTANARILVANKENTLLIPVEAVQEEGDRFFVMLPSATDSRMSPGNRQEIKIGLHNDTYVEVLEGLQEGDSILQTRTSGTGTFGNQKNDNRPPNPGMMPGMSGGFGGPGPRQ